MAPRKRSNPFPFTTGELKSELRLATDVYWDSRTSQAEKQKLSGRTDQGTRSEVTGGRHLDGYCNVIQKVIAEAGFAPEDVRIRTGVDLPGFFRPTKKWDIVVTREGVICAVIEMKSQAGSFGNNFNNRAEEAIGSSIDFWTAYREGVIGAKRPWLGYFFLLEDTPKSRAPVSLSASIFEPMPIFKGTSYADRYAILGQRLLLERNYDGVTLILTSRDAGGSYSEPYADLAFEPWAKALYGHLIGCL